MDGETAFAALANRLAREPDVELGTGFGAVPGLRVKGRIFAMLQHGELVVKLPAGRRAAMVSAGDARPLVVRQHTMREWIVVEGVDDDAWAELADEALRYVRSRGRRPDRPQRR